MTNTQEIWFPIPGYEGLYELSNLDRIKSISRIILKKGKFPFTSKDKILSGYKNKKGYIRYSMYNNGFKKYIEFHVIKAIVFLSHTPCGQLRVVDHIDNDPTNNDISNLQIITTRENSSKDRKNDSGYIGVSWDKKSKKWKAKIEVNSKQIHLGYFENAIIAHDFYKEALNSIKEGKDIKINKPTFSSDYKGVNWHKIANKWQARVYLNGKMKHLGLFNNELDACSAIYKFNANKNPVIY